MTMRHFGLSLGVAFDFGMAFDCGMAFDFGMAFGAYSEEAAWTSGPLASRGS